MHQLRSILLVLLACYINMISAIVTYYNETFVLPQYTYVEFLRSTLKLLESEYEPGQISAFLSLGGQNQIYGSNAVTTPVSPSQFDLIMFQNPQNQMFKNYIKAIQNQQWNLTDFQNICLPCSSCLQKQNSNQIDLSNFTTTLCCLNCPMTSEIMLNILGNETSVQFDNFENLQNSPMIVILDNTPFPNGDTAGLTDLFFDSSYKIEIQPNQQYFTATLVLCVAFGGILLVGSVVILSMRRQYQQAKAEEVTRNLVNPENRMSKKQN